MENRPKDQQVDLSADRTFCHRFWSNQFRQLLSALAYTLMKGLRRLVLRHTVLVIASPNRILLTLLRIGAVVLRNTRRIRLLSSSTCPHQELFHTVSPGHLLIVTECCPGTLTNNEGKGEGCPQ